LNSIQPLLSILIPSTPDRRHLLSYLLECILKQQYLRLVQEFDVGNITAYRYYDTLATIEILIMEDKKENSVGVKRQKLLEHAKGVWTAGVDSDDLVADTYLEDILKALETNPDHVGFLEDCDINGEKSLSIFSIKHQQWDENTDGYDHIRCANPKSVIRRSIALQVGYEDLRFGEDRVFSEAVTPLLKSEIFIDKPLYYYRHISSPHNERYGI